MAKKVVCKNCGYVGKSKQHTDGNILIELVLWLLFLLPGLIYSIWRLTTRKTVCAKCGSTNIIPVDSPQGQKLVGAKPKQVAKKSTAKKK